jgi:hypothetical protein
MITLTLVEDLAVVVLTVILPGLSPSSHENFAHVAFRIAKSLLLLIPIAAAAWKFVPRLLSRVEKTCNDEISLLLALNWHGDSRRHWPHADWRVFLHPGAGLPQRGANFRADLSRHARGLSRDDSGERSAVPLRETFRRD